jgi:hypothetical protein
MNDRKLNRIFTIALAVMLAIFSGHAQQKPTSAFNFRALVSPGTRIGGHTFGLDTTIDGIALSDKGHVAFVAHWPEPGIEGDGCVFTLAGLVACHGDVIDGKPIKSITANSLAIDNSGEVGFEAVYGDASQTGVFVGRKFAVTLNGPGSTDDFILSEDGKVALRSRGTATTVPASAPASGKLPRWLAIASRIHIVPPAVLRGPNSPLGGDSTVVVQTQSGTTPPSPPPTQPKAKAVPGQSERECAALPTFPYPSEWEVGAPMPGPITSHVWEDPVSGRGYDSPFGRMNAPFRNLQFASDCRPTLIVIGDNAVRRYELWSPAGILTFTGPDGLFHFEGFTGKVTPGPLLKTDTPLRINRRGQIALPVRFDAEGWAILLATPAEGSR